MYSDKENINILTALLLAHGVEDAVVCPGSRNAPIVHNLHECPSMRCHPVTDERSAGFVALGLAQATGRPVAVCVTSGTALLNLCPAVAEAAYQHLPLVVISADRPSAWIGQLDGQTLPQPGALGRFVRTCADLPEPHDDTERWQCNRLVNEALCMATLRRPAPVHINVPITEPLFGFTTPALPTERKMEVAVARAAPAGCLADFLGGERPMVVIGQTPEGYLDDSALRQLRRRAVVLSEALGCGAVRFDEVLHAVGRDPRYMPTHIIYMGDTVVSKRLRRFLRLSGAPALLLTPDASQMADPTMGVTRVVECAGLPPLEGTGPSEGAEAFVALWRGALAKADAVAADHEPPYSQMAAVKYFEEQTEDLCEPFHVHYANSSVVRLANIYGRSHVWCNRGVNGIEGSLSTAAGFSLGTADKVFCLTGDLSFFYDQNALWNDGLGGNLRILLLNNSGGGIFHQLRGLGASPALPFVEGAHHADARGICTQNDIGYLAAHTMDEMQIGIVTLLTRQATRPMVLEVFTNADDDAQAVASYYGKLRL